MIKQASNNFVQFKKSHFAELARHLSILEGYIFGKNKNAINCDYWGICAEGGEENTIVKLQNGLEGKPLKINWSQIENTFPRLIELLDEHNLHYYIGKNYVGNWGVHRHIYDTTSTMNLCLLVDGNNGGTVNFHEFENDSNFDELSDTHIFDLHDQEFSTNSIIETVNINDGQAYSFNTGQWHSHIVKGETAELFLLHFKDADRVGSIIDQFDNVPW